MKKLIVGLVFVVTSCSSVKKHNEHLNDFISVEKLKQDVDYAYTKIQKMHPKLYWYISKTKLDFKFDSIKKTITKPLTSKEFYKKITPIICEVKQGHMFVYPSVKEYSTKELKSIKKVGINPIAQFDFELFDNKLYVVKNKSNDLSIKVGSEVKSINGNNPINLIEEYNNYFTSDGFNKSFKRNFSGKKFSTIFSYEYGLNDSLKYDFKFNDSIKTVVIKRKNKEANVKTKEKIVFTQFQKDSVKAKVKAFKIR